MPTSHRLPWASNHTPLMLAPMQGLTNRAMRSLFIEWVRPDVVFTEFMRVSGVSRKRLKPGDLQDVGTAEQGVPLVVQVVGHGRRPLVEAAKTLQNAGAQHINLNLGCPYGRMTTAATGGKLLEHPEELAEIVPALRDAISGSFSIKLRAGYRATDEIFALLTLFETTGVDFLVVHPRTVVQEYRGSADHGLTARVIRSTHLPVIANGDIRTADQGRQVLRETGACGLMLGRGAIANPLLFTQIRAGQASVTSRQARGAMLQHYLLSLLDRYGKIFCGEGQVLSKLKGVLPFLDDPDFSPGINQLKKSRTLEQFARGIVALDEQSP